LRRFIFNFVNSKCLGCAPQRINYAKIAMLPSEPEIIELDTCILGGGFAGVYCGKELGRAARQGDGLRTALIAAENHMVFQPMLPEVASASLSPRHVVNPIRQICPGIDVFKGEVFEIHAKAKSLFLWAGDFTPKVKVNFRRLVVALGAVVNLSRVPGMTEHALLMQNVGDAMKLRSTVIARFEEANLVFDPILKRRLLTFVVVGGGYSGVETAGGLLDMMAEMNKFYVNVGPSDYSVLLVHSQDHLLPTLSRTLGDYAQNKLEKRGLQILLQERVKAVTAKSVVLQSGRVLETVTVVSTVGNAPHPLVLNLAAQLELKTDRGRLSPDATGAIPGHDWLWACGDCAAIPMPDGQPSPPTAQFAQRQGTLVGRNIVAQRRGRTSRNFAFKGLGELAAIGHRTAVGDVFGLKVSGFLAWWMWRTVYLSKLPGLQRKLRVAVDWTFDLFFSRDLNLLNPRFSKLLREIYLEKGDTLFFPGEPAFSLYFVKSGQISLRDGEQVVKVVKGGDYFGERALLEDRLWRFQAVADEATYLVGLGADEFQIIIAGSQDLQRLFTRSAQAYLASEDVERLKKEISPEIIESAVSKIMNTKVECLSAETSLKAAMALFKVKRHGSYPVLDDAGKLVGMLGRDALYDAWKTAKHGKDAKVGELRLSTLPTIPAETTTREALEILLRSGKNKLCVTDENKSLLGLLTLVDIVEASSNEAVAGIPEMDSQ
jgi:NADH:ubiquinone reductase (H+-translocating)